MAISLVKAVENIFTFYEYIFTNSASVLGDDFIFTIYFYQNSKSLVLVVITIIGLVGKSSYRVIFFMAKNLIKVR